MSFFGLGINSKKYWYFLLAFLFYLFRSYLFSIHFSCPPCNALIKVILMCFGMSLSLIFEYISNQRQISLRKYQNTNNSNSILIIFSLNIFDLISFFLLNYLPYQSTTSFYGKDEIQIIIEFFFVALLLFILHKLIMYKHHIFFTCTMVFGLIIISLSNILSPTDNKTVHYLNIITLIVPSLLYSFLLVGEKYLMEKKYVSPYMIVGFEGVFGFIVSVIVIILLKMFNETSFIINFTKEERKLKDIVFIINMILFILSSLGYNIFVMLINQSFGANNRVVCDFISVFCSLIINRIFGFDDGMNEYNFVMILIGHCFVLIGVVGFNEIVIVYCCDLEINTHKQITERASCSEGINISDTTLITQTKYIQMQKQTIDLINESDDE